MLRILPETWRKSLAKFLGDLLPSSCLLCGQSTASVLCPACADELPALSTPTCPQCADLTTHGERCGRCLTKPPHFDRTIALYNYAFPLDRLIHAYKYRNELALGQYFGQQLATRLQDSVFDRILPVPLHPQRLRQRGFNQALELARPLATHLNTPLDYRLLQRQRVTVPQAELHPRQRSANILGAFSVQGEVDGQHLLLIDDVLTTGATLSECARILKLHGAASVTVAVVARTTRN